MLDSGKRSLITYEMRLKVSEGRVVALNLDITLSEEFLTKVQNCIDETWDGMPPEYTIPDLSSVVLNAFDIIAEYAADDAAELAKCSKVDSCSAESLVLQELAALFRGLQL